MNIKIHPLLTMLVVLCFIAALLTIPVLCFYVLPKALVWLVNAMLFAIGVRRWLLPFNVITWCLAMYVLWMLGVVRFVSKEMKSTIQQAFGK